MRNEGETAVRAMVDLETKAWDRKDAAPITWVMPLGRFNAERWRASWQDLFDTHDLMSNHRVIQRVEVTPEGDGGFAVVDIDTTWRRRLDQAEDRWRGRTCKVYARCGDSWKMTMQTGVLHYGSRI